MTGITEEEKSERRRMKYKHLERRKGTKKELYSSIIQYITSCQHVCRKKEATNSTQKK